jgi:hypothetical protein
MVVDYTVGLAHQGHDEARQGGGRICSAITQDFGAFLSAANRTFPREW